MPPQRKRLSATWHNVLEVSTFTPRKWGCLITRLLSPCSNLAHSLVQLKFLICFVHHATVERSESGCLEYQRHHGRTAVGAVEEKQVSRCYVQGTGESSSGWSIRWKGKIYTAMHLKMCRRCKHASVLSAVFRGTVVFLIVPAAGNICLSGLDRLPLSSRRYRSYDPLSLTCFAVCPYDLLINSLSFRVALSRDSARPRPQQPAPRSAVLSMS